MLVHILLFALMASFTFHVISLIFYFLYKSIRLFYLFISTALMNMFLGIILSIYAFKDPGTIKSINYDMILWVLSGLILLIMICIKGFIVKRVFSRLGNPDNYTYNYFGKKVYSKNIVTYPELGAVFLSLPFFLLVGAYFVAKLFNYLKVS